MQFFEMDNGSWTLNSRIEYSNLNFSPYNVSNTFSGKHLFLAAEIAAPAISFNRDGTAMLLGGIGVNSVATSRPVIAFVRDGSSWRIAGGIGPKLGTNNDSVTNFGSAVALGDGGHFIVSAPRATGFHIYGGQFAIGCPTIPVVEITSSSATVDLAVSKSATVTEATVGTPFDYMITVTNNGPDDATNVVLTEVLPVGFTYNAGASSASDGGICTENSGTVTCAWASLANGNTVTATINVTP